MRPIFALLILAPSLALAQTANPSDPPADSHRAFLNRFWLSVQANFIRQQHSTFFSPYSGPNSFQAPAEHATSHIETLYTGFQITNNLDFIADIESAGGFGLSNALGIAGFVNVDVVRNPTLPQTPYFSRLMLHYTIPLGKETTEATRNPLSLAPTVPTKRLELRLGHISTVDFFDLNSIGSDSHNQFMNWTVDNNGAYDYAADTRGYTYGFVAEYYNGNWAARFGEMLMPTVANGITLDWDLARARAENYEAEYHTSLLPRRSTIIRALSFVNHANMGSYQQAIHGYLSGKDAVPDITLYRKQGRVKYGFGLNVEQELTPLLRAYLRCGWNDGKNESFAYTEVDRTASFGSDLKGNPWHRSQDKIGVAFVWNALSSDHKEYLALGGLGFILGDGRLNYGLEKIIETYYNFHLYRGITTAFDYQFVDNPGYNQDRGPASIFSIRLHIEDAIPFDKLSHFH